MRIDPEERPDHRAGATEDVHAPDDHGRDHCELQALARDGGDVPEPREEQEAGQAGHRAATDERPEDVALHRQAGGRAASGLEPIA